MLLISRIVWAKFWVGRSPLSDHEQADDSPDSRCLGLETFLIFFNTRLFILFHLIVPSWSSIWWVGGLLFLLLCVICSAVLLHSGLDSPSNFERVNIYFELCYRKFQFNQMARFSKCLLSRLLLRELLIHFSLHRKIQFSKPN